jgi:hypothetical protein
MSSTPIALFTVAVVLLFFSTFWWGRRDQEFGSAKININFDRDRNRIKFGIQVAVSLILLSASLYVILITTFTADDRKWGFATIGTIIGFWLKGPYTSPNGRFR